MAIMGVDKVDWIEALKDSPFIFYGGLVAIISLIFAFMLPTLAFPFFFLAWVGIWIAWEGVKPILHREGVKERNIRKIGYILIILFILWFLPVQRENVSDDTGHWSPHPCGTICDFNKNGINDIEEDRLKFQEEHPYEFYECLDGGGCVYVEEGFALSGDYAYRNIFGITIYRNLEWIS
jgi:hypothetical protein